MYPEFFSGTYGVTSPRVWTAVTGLCVTSVMKIAPNQPTPPQKKRANFAAIA
jgi:hypothetical protein